MRRKGPLDSLWLIGFAAGMAFLSCAIGGINKESANTGDPETTKPTTDPCTEGLGCHVEIENRAYVEHFPVSGTPFTLYYTSYRQPGASNVVEYTVPVTRDECQDIAWLHMHVVDPAGTVISTNWSWQRTPIGDIPGLENHLCHELVCLQCNAEFRVPETYSTLCAANLATPGTLTSSVAVRAWASAFGERNITILRTYSYQMTYEGPSYTYATFSSTHGTFPSLTTSYWMSYWLDKCGWCTDKHPGTRLTSGGLGHMA